VDGHSLKNKSSFGAGRNIIYYFVVPVFMVLLALHANVKTIRRNISVLREPSCTDDLLYEQRLQPLRRSLPEHSIVGYVTDEKSADKYRLFFLTQYSLCPILVVEGSHYPLVIGGYYGRGAPVDQSAKGPEIVKDFGNGILLLRGAY
jgi:hypothetical protein